MSDGGAISESCTWTSRSRVGEVCAHLNLETERSRCTRLPEKNNFPFEMVCFSAFGATVCKTVCSTLAD